MPDDIATDPTILPADPTVQPVPPAAPITIGEQFRKDAAAQAEAEASTRAAVEADAKAKADAEAAVAERERSAAGLRAIGKPFVEPQADGTFLIREATRDAEGRPGYSVDHGVGPDTPIPAE